MYTLCNKKQQPLYYIVVVAMWISAIIHYCVTVKSIVNIKFPCSAVTFVAVSELSVISSSISSENT